LATLLQNGKKWLEILLPGHGDCGFLGLLFLKLVYNYFDLHGQLLVTLNFLFTSLLLHRNNTLFCLFLGLWAIVHKRVPDDIASNSRSVDVARGRGATAFNAPIARAGEDCSKRRSLFRG
jgi:hypothetical protein